MRHRLQRDVHDSAQQRLVHTIVALKLAQRAITSGQDPGELIEEALRNAQRASRDLRDIVRGILPAALSRGGLAAGLETLVEDVVLPVGLYVDVPRLPPALETTAYFVIAEALANVVKHANARSAAIEARLSRGRRLVIDVRDDGDGGADPARGTGLVGSTACVVAALWPQRCAGLVSVNGYLIQDIAASGAPIAPELEAGFWYFWYFLTERGRAGLTANRREIARVIWRRNSPAWSFDGVTLDGTATAFDNPD